MSGFRQVFVGGLLGYLAVLATIVLLPVVFVLFAAAGITVVCGLLVLLFAVVFDPVGHLFAFAFGMLAWGALPSFLGAAGYHFYQKTARRRHELDGSFFGQEQSSRGVSISHH